MPSSEPPSSSQPVQPQPVQSQAVQPEQLTLDSASESRADFADPPQKPTHSQRYVAVAVPVPHLGPLTYALPERLPIAPQPGMRCRVPLGKRAVEGVIVELLDTAPEGIRLRAVAEIVDREPVLSAELLALGHFIADYYLAPIGEVLRSMVPQGVSAWGKERVRITNAGALASCDDGRLLAVLDLLRDGSPRSVSELTAAATLDLLWPILGELRERDWIRYEGRSADRGSRFGKAYELVEDEPEALYQRCGRSKPGRRAIDVMLSLQRSVTREELLDAAECGVGVLRRLVKVGVLREFVEVRSLDLERHRLSAEAQPEFVLTAEQETALSAIVRALDHGALGLAAMDYGALEQVALNQGVHDQAPLNQTPPDQRSAQTPDAKRTDASVEDDAANESQARSQPESQTDVQTPNAFLLHGITGSGKTEVYLRAAQFALQQGRSALILVPEIALVPALAKQVRARFGDCHAILHSGLSRQERAQEWQRIRSGAARVVVGPRSALFAPMPSLGLLIVDEEHDSSYKQENSPRYHGRDMAYVRAQGVGATLVLGSATPSMETRFNVQRNRVALLTMGKRVGGARLPEGQVVDLREEQPPRRPGEIVFSRALVAELQNCLDNKKQAILLRNRRGYAPVLLCSACGHDHECAECGLAQTVHRKAGLLKCHYCGASRQIPDRCADCNSNALEAVGAGTERVEEQVLELFPNARVEVLDRDSARGAGLREILERFGSGQRDILVGTQMVAKGHHFPNVALAAVLNADTYISFPDFRGVERAYSLLSQLAGRAGRGEVPGKVIIQTRQPDHYAIRAALQADDQKFAEREMLFRERYSYPPFSRLVEVVTEDRNRDRAREEIESIARKLRQQPTAERLRILGPQPPPHERIAGRWRFQLLAMGSNSRLLRSAIAQALPERSSARVAVDVDPYQLF